MQPSLFETNALTLNKNYNKVEKGIQEFQHKKGPAYESLRRRESTSDASHSFTTSERNMCKGIYCWASSLLSSYVIFRNIFSPTCGSTDFLPSLFSSRPVTPTVSHFLVSLQNNYFFSAAAFQAFDHRIWKSCVCAFALFAFECPSASLFNCCGEVVAITLFVNDHREECMCVLLFCAWACVLK